MLFTVGVLFQDYFRKFNIVDRSAPTSRTDRLVKRQNVCVQDNSYHDCQFILGSVVEIERVLSAANPILVNGRHSMTHQVLEALIFLKYNAQFWHSELVTEATML